jgi:hypothetical protein
MERNKYHSRLYKKLNGTPNCAANRFAEMELGRDSRRGKCIGQIVKYWYRIMWLDVENPVKQCYELQKRNMNMRSWTIEVQEELYNTGSAFLWTEQQECNLREIKKILKDRCNDSERQNILAQLLEKSSLTLY